MKTESYLGGNPSNLDMHTEAYKYSFADYVKGIGPWGSPFSFLSYGVNYKQMIAKIQQSSEFLHFIILFIIDLEKPSEYEKAMAVLYEAGISQEQLQNELYEALS